jgi:hypothetical protein
VDINCFPEYSAELRLAIDGRLDTIAAEMDERALRQSLNDTNRQWREGALKMSFCYLLIDPRFFDSICNFSGWLNIYKYIHIFRCVIFDIS